MTPTHTATATIRASAGTAKARTTVATCTTAEALTRLDLLFRKFGHAPQDILLREVITAYRKEFQP